MKECLLNIFKSFEEKNIGLRFMKGSSMQLIQTGLKDQVNTMHIPPLQEYPVKTANVTDWRNPMNSKHLGFQQTSNAATGKKERKEKTWKKRKI